MFLDNIAKIKISIQMSVAWMLKSLFIGFEFAVNFQVSKNISCE
jgi:hypothetical protein